MRTLALVSPSQAVAQAGILACSTGESPGLGAPAPTATGGVLRSYQVLARWRAPVGRARTGRIPVSAGLAAGRTVWLWVDPAGIPLNHRLIVADEAIAAVIATRTPGIVLLCLAWAGRWVIASTDEFLDASRIGGILPIHP